MSMIQPEPVAIITGATRGIGKAIAQKVSSKGISCICIGSSRGSIRDIKLGEHLQLTKEHQKHRSLAIDLSQWPQWLSHKKHFGIDYCSNNLESSFPLMDFKSWNSPHRRYCLSLVVNCAGITQKSLSLRTSTDEIQRMMNINFLSTVSMCNLATRCMIRNRSRWDNLPLLITNVSSVLGETDITVEGTSIYSASKAAVSRYSKVLSEEVSNWGIRVNSIAPALVDSTDMTRGLDDLAKARLRNAMGTERSTPQEIASTIWSIYINS